MKSKVYLLVIACLCTAFAWGQTRQVTGRVVSDSSIALAGVSVTVKGTTTTVATNNDGRYSINIPNRDNVVLTFSSVGYSPQDVGVGNRSVLNVTLYTQASALNDVVVIGYQTVRRRDLTSAVSSVTAKQLKDVPLNSAAEALAGRLAGVQITGTEGTPDADVLIKVRGGGSITQDNSPLYIIDGVQVENALSVISPQDIQSIDVLKDASATAIYGARGANGVVIITTKGGGNHKAVISYNGLVGVDQLANKLDVMNPYDFVMYQYERSRGSSQSESDFEKTYGTFQDIELYKSVPFVDWQEQMFGRNALRTTHNVSLNGGQNGTSYNLSLTYNYQQGVQLSSDFDRKLVNFKLDHKFSKLLKLGFSTRYNHTLVNGAGTSNPGSSATNRLRNSIKYRPFLIPGQNLMDYDAEYASETNANSLALVNPLLLNQAEYKRRYLNVTNLSGYADLHFTDWLTFRSTLGVDMYNDQRNNFYDSITYTSRSKSSGNPVAMIETSNRLSINNSNVLTFDNNAFNSEFADKNHITFLVGQEIYQVRNNEINLASKDFPLGISPETALQNMGLGTSYIDSRPSYQSDDHLLSFFSRFMYDYDGRYLLQLSARADGSSKFSAANRWGYFPSGSFAWRISRERFFEPLQSAINDLKLRASFGEAGNNRIGNTLYQTQYDATAEYWLGDVLVSAYQPAALANENLKWETTISRDLGLDIAFLRNKMQLSVDLYKNTTRDLLINVPVSTDLGYDRQTQNVGSTESKGLELQLTANLISKRDFSWDASFNASFGRVKVKSLSKNLDYYATGSGWSVLKGNNDYIVQVGQYLGSMYGYVTEGFYTIDDFNYDNGVYTLKSGIPTNKVVTSVDPQPGFLKLKDINNDGVVDGGDRTIIGVAQPKMFGGWNNQFRYKNWDLSVFINYQFGNDVYNANKLEFTNGYQGNSDMLAIMNNRWRTVNDQGQVVTDPTELSKLNANATLWQPSRQANSFNLHSWAVEDGSFVRLNNITLGYNFPDRWLGHVFKTARVYATASNLHVFSNYSGYDPEVSTRRGSPETPGVDYSAYPRSHTYIVGVNLSF